MLSQSINSTLKHGSNRSPQYNPVATVTIPAAEIFSDIPFVADSTQSIKEIRNQLRYSSQAHEHPSGSQTSPLEIHDPQIMPAIFQPKTAIDPGQGLNRGLVRTGMIPSLSSSRSSKESHSSLRALNKMQLKLHGVASHIQNHQT